MLNVFLRFLVYISWRMQFHYLTCRNSYSTQMTECVSVFLQLFCNDVHTYRGSHMQWWVSLMVAFFEFLCHLLFTPLLKGSRESTVVRYLFFQCPTPAD